MINNKVVIQIARKIRATRADRNMTIQQVASRANVSKGLVSRIENARTVPSLPVFVNLLNALEISPKDFFAEMSLREGSNYLLIKRNETSVVEREGRKGFSYQHIISQSLPDSYMEVFLLSIETLSNSTPVRSAGFELKFVITGSCEYIIDGNTLQLDAGDTLYFNGETPHAPTATNGVTFLVIHFH